MGKEGVRSGSGEPLQQTAPDFIPAAVAEQVRKAPPSPLGERPQLENILSYAHFKASQYNHLFHPAVGPDSGWKGEPEREGGPSWKNKPTGCLSVPVFNMRVWKLWQESHG